MSTVQTENTAINEKYNESLSANIKLKQKLSESEQEKSKLIKTHEKEISNLNEKHKKSPKKGRVIHHGINIDDIKNF